MGFAMLELCHDPLPHSPYQKPTNSNFVTGFRPSEHRSRWLYGVRLC